MHKRFHRLFQALVFLISLTLPVIALGDGPSFLESYADPVHPKNIVAIFDSASPNGIYLLRSTNGGATWVKVPAPDGSAVRKGGRGDISDFFVRAGKGAKKGLVVVYAQFGLFRAERDLRWERLPGVPGDAQALVPTPDAERFFVVVSAGEGSALYWTESGGLSWMKRAHKLPFSCNLGFCIEQLAASSDGRQIVYRPFTGEGHVSQDEGKSWQPQSTEKLEKEFSALTASPSSAIKGTSKQVEAALQTLKSRQTEQARQQLAQTQGQTASFQNIRTTVSCRDSSFPGQIFTLVDPNSVEQDMFLDQSKIIAMLNFLRDKATRTCENDPVHRGRVRRQHTIMVGIKDLGGWSVYFSAGSNIDGSWRITDNYIADEIRRRREAEQWKLAKEREEAQRRAEQERLAREQREKEAARQNRWNEFARNSGVQELVKDSDLFTNPFLYQAKTVAVSIRFLRMIAANSGLFDGGGGSLFVVSNIPTGTFRSQRERDVLAVKFIGMTEVKGLPIVGSMQVPNLRFVGLHFCTQGGCGDIVK